MFILPRDPWIFAHKIHGYPHWNFSRRMRGECGTQFCTFSWNLYCAVFLEVNLITWCPMLPDIWYAWQHLTCVWWLSFILSHDDVIIKWKHFPCYWPFVWGIHRSPVNSPHKCQWRGALMFSLIWAWINGWVNNRDAGDLRRHRDNYDVTLM